MQHAQQVFGMAGDDPLDDLARAIATAVVDEDHLGSPAQGVEHAKRLGHAGLEVRLLVVAGDDEGEVDLGHGTLRPAVPGGTP
jgi:hypothetical protein